jgi:hypothetical protein
MITANLPLCPPSEELKLEQRLTDEKVYVDGWSNRDISKSVPTADIVDPVFLFWQANPYFADGLHFLV